MAINEKLYKINKLNIINSQSLWIFDKKSRNMKRKYISLHIKFPISIW